MVAWCCLAGKVTVGLMERLQPTAGYMTVTCGLTASTGIRSGPNARIEYGQPLCFYLALQGSFRSWSTRDVKPVWRQRGPAAVGVSSRGTPLRHHGIPAARRSRPVLTSSFSGGSPAGWRQWRRGPASLDDVTPTSSQRHFRHRTQVCIRFSDVSLSVF